MAEEPFFSITHSRYMDWLDHKDEQRKLWIYTTDFDSIMNEIKAIEIDGILADPDSRNMISNSYSRWTERAERIGTALEEKKEINPAKYQVLKAELEAIIANEASALAEDQIKHQKALEDLGNDASLRNAEERVSDWEKYKQRNNIGIYSWRRDDNDDFAAIEQGIDEMEIDKILADPDAKNMIKEESKKWYERVDAVQNLVEGIKLSHRDEYQKLTDRLEKVVEEKEKEFLKDQEEHEAQLAKLADESSNHDVSKRLEDWREYNDDRSFNKLMLSFPDELNSIQRKVLRLERRSAIDKLFTSSQLTTSIISPAGPNNVRRLDDPVEQDPLLQNKKVSYPKNEVDDYYIKSIKNELQEAARKAHTKLAEWHKKSDDFDLKKDAQNKFIKANEEAERSWQKVNLDPEANLEDFRESFKTGEDLLKFYLKQVDDKVVIPLMEGKTPKSERKQEAEEKKKSRPTQKVGSLLFIDDTPLDTYVANMRAQEQRVASGGRRV